jgi:DNA-binding transcriptional MerR regulator
MLDAAPLTLDELSTRTGVAPRTIRLYQTRGLLPAPARSGRSAAYGSPHVERLELIAALHKRGLLLDAIRDLLHAHPEAEVTVRSWAGLGHREGGAGTREEPASFTEAEVIELVAGRPPATLTALLRAELLVRHPAGYVGPNPTLLAVALSLQDAGVPLETTLAAGDIIRDRLAQAARQLVALFADQLGRERRLADLGAALDALLPAGAASVQTIFAEEVERAIGQRVGRPRPPSTRP